MDPEPHLPEHLTHLELRNQRPRSIRERRLAVLRNNRRLGKPLAEATRDDLREWQQTIAHLTPGGRHCEIVHTVQFIRWTITAEYRTDDPTGVIVRPQLNNRGNPRPMSDADVGVALLTAPQPERAWIALGAFCGLRCMEIAGLRRNEVLDNQTPAVLEIEGKGGKRRKVPLPERVLAELADAGAARRGYLWSRMDGAPGPPSAMRVSERINKHLHSLGITGTAHTLRHRFGTRLYEATRDIALVAEVMGHSKTDTTRLYVQVSALDAASPIELISRLSGVDS
ncbi:MAG TPA: site-specific integrase [Mycobacterium sp.]|nr:site-specific integrase [Mycobacterium sp.]